VLGIVGVVHRLFSSRPEWSRFVHTGPMCPKNADVEGLRKILSESFDHLGSVQNTPEKEDSRHSSHDAIQPEDMQNF